MNRLYLIIGITLFILIIGATYNLNNIDSKNNKNNENNKNEVDYIDEVLYKGKIPLPIENFIKVTSGFGYRESVVNNDGKQISGGKSHLGIDLVGKQNSRVISIADGEVTFSGWQNGYGNCVEIKHISEDKKFFYSFYGHMQDNSLQVKKGQKVSIGQVIGIQGTTGNSTGDHLHFEIRTNTGSSKYAIDPAPYLFEEK